MSQPVLPELTEEIFLGSPLLAGTLSILRKIAAADVHFLIWGESGSGKNLFAYLAHRLGPRRDGPYVEISCSSLPDLLVESELFGYVRGAFTGAASNHPGRLGQADQGTLVLDELDCLSPAAQAKLLRVVELGRYTPMGGQVEQNLRIRCIGLTQSEPTGLVSRGLRREDLFYRLAHFTLALPPLRTYLDRLPELTAFLAGSEARRHRTAPIRVTPEALRIMARHPFPGNVRELMNLVRRWTLLHPGAAISPAEVPPELQPEAAPAALKTLAEVEREHILRALREAGGHKGEAARQLGIHRKTLLEKRKRYGLD